MRHLRNLTLLLMFGLLFGLLVACNDDSDQTENPAKGTDQNGEKGQVLHLASPDVIPTMDPALATDESSQAFIRNISEGLYRLNGEGELVDGIATDRKVSEDGLTWTFTLREDAVWANGDPVTAHDFVYSWRRAVDPDTGSEYGPYMMNEVIKNATEVSKGELAVEELGVKADGDYTLVVELENPTAYFERLTSFTTFLPVNQKFVEEQGDNFATSSDTLLASGPFTLKNWKSTSSSWDLVKNEDYWDADTVQLDKITFEVVKDPATAISLYEEGTIDRTDLTSDFVDQYASHEDYVVQPSSFVYFLKFNQEGNKALANTNIRAAISRAFDKQALVDEILNDGSIAANGLIPTDFTKVPGTDKDFRTASGDLVTYELEAAKEYWEKGLAEIGKDTVELELLVTDDGTINTISEYIANQLQTNLKGLKVTLKTVPKKQRIDLDSKMNYDIQLSRWGPDYLDPYTYMNLWLTDGGNNNMGYSNADYDKLVLATAKELATDNEARYQNFLKAEKILFKDAAIAPIYQNSKAQLVSSKIKGLPTNPFVPQTEYKWVRIED